MKIRAGGARGKRGSTIVMMAVTLFSMLGLAALAIDLASLRDARSEAQRTADAVALAGASAFRDLPWVDAATMDVAQDRALEIARRNMVRSDTIDVRNPVTHPLLTYPWGSVRVVQTPSNQLELNIIPDSQKVRAWIRHAGVQTFFGGLLGVPYGHVQAKAAAWATNNGPIVNCLKPFVMPDMWYEGDKATQDVNGNDYMDPITTVTGNTQDGESWKYQPASIGGTDYYAPYNPDIINPTQPQTGYGSDLRNTMGYPRDLGLPILLKPQTGSGNTKPAPERMGNAFWLLDLDPDLNVKEEVTGFCGNAAIGDSVPYKSGSNTSVRQAVDDLISQDANAYWDNTTHRVENSNYPDWTESPRVVTVGLIDPIYWIANSANTKPDPGSTFTNFVRIFFLPLDRNGPPENIHAVYVGPAPGGTGGPTGGTLVKILQLIE